MKNYSDSDAIRDLRKIYQNVELEFIEVHFPAPVIVFTLFFTNSKDLKKDWDKVSSSIAALYQTNLGDEEQFKRWNIYLMYISKTSVDLSLKYTIENDKFSSRKIVVDDFDKELSAENIQGLIENYITNKDLITSYKKHSTLDDQNTYTSNSLVWDVITRSSNATNKFETHKELETLLNTIERKLNL